MIGLLLWIIGALVLAIEITSRHMWREIAAAMMGAAFVLWVVGGAFLISMRGKWPTKPGAPALPTAQQVANLRAVVGRGERAANEGGK